MKSNFRISITLVWEHNEVKSKSLRQVHEKSAAYPVTKKHYFKSLLD